MMPRIIVSGTRMARVRPSTITILKPSRIVLPLVVVRTTRCPPPAAARWRDGEVAVKPRDSAAAVAVAVAVDLELDLDLDLPGPLRSGGGGGQDPQGAAHGCAAFSARAGCPLGKSSRLRGPGASAPGAQAGCAFFAPGFFAQAKKGGSRRHRANALDLDVSEGAAGEDPPDGTLSEQLASQDPPYGACCHRRPGRASFLNCCSLSRDAAAATRTSPADRSTDAPPAAPPPPPAPRNRRRCTCGCTPPASPRPPRNGSVAPRPSRPARDG